MSLCSQDMAGNMDRAGHRAIHDRLKERMVNSMTHLLKVTVHTRIEYSMTKEILSLARMLRSELRQHPNIPPELWTRAVHTRVGGVTLGGTILSSMIYFNAVSTMTWSHGGHMRSKLYTRISGDM